MITLLDYGAGNLISVKNAIEYLGEPCEITDDPDKIRSAAKLIFPGVGAFGDLMKNLENKGLAGPLKEYLSSGRPFLGVCLGLQALFEESEESPGVKGLGFFKGKVVRFRHGLKIPQIGWNSADVQKENLLIEKGSKDYFYFVHSYYVVPEDESIILSKTDYGYEFVSGVNKGSVYAVQFHPERSGDKGLELLKRFILLR